MDPCGGGLACHAHWSSSKCTGFPDPWSRASRAPGRPEPRAWQLALVRCSSEQRVASGALGLRARPRVPRILAAPGEIRSAATQPSPRHARPTLTSGAPLATAAMLPELVSCARTPAPRSCTHTPGARFFHAHECARARGSDARSPELPSPPLSATAAAGAGIGVAVLGLKFRSV